MSHPAMSHPARDAVDRSPSVAVVDYGRVTLREAAPGIAFAPVLVGELGASLMELAQGVRTDFHHHADPQISFVISGRIRFVLRTESGEEVREAGASTLVAIPGNVPHRIEVLEATRLVECWAPAGRHEHAALVRL